MADTELEWKKNRSENPLHSLCSYLAMFPPSLPRFFIDRYSKENDIVFDPFSGRGTTVLEACDMGRIGIGNDKNPLAVILSKAKANVPQKGRVLSRISILESNYSEEEISVADVEPKIKMIFSQYTLKQLVFLKGQLNLKNKVDIFVAALVLGIMHGGSEGYLSISMPNTFSMAPNYIKNYIKEHKLKRPKRDVFNLLRRKLDRCYYKPKKDGSVINQDVTKMTRLDEEFADLIITSPPYTRVIKYGEYNWIRLWFLGEESREVDRKLFFTESVGKYCIFMTKALAEMKRVLKPNGKIILVIGDVRNRNNGITKNLAEVVYENCARPLRLKLVEPIITDIIGDGRKVSKIWGAKRGNATKIDRILILTREMIH